MIEAIERTRFVKYRFGFFALHLLLLLFCVWNVYAFRRFNPEGPDVFVRNENLFFVFFGAGVFFFAISTVLKKTFRGFVLSSTLCLLVSFLGFVILSVADTFYFPLWFILGILGAGIHLVRFSNCLEKN